MSFVKTTEPFDQCPANSKLRSDVGAGQYKSLSDNIKSFQDLGEIPMKFDPERIDVSGNENSLMKIKLHARSWHKSCRNKFNTTDFKRAKK